MSPMIFYPNYFYRIACLRMVFLINAILLPALSFYGYAYAQQLEEVIVTAQQREESLQDVSVSVTALSSEKLSDFGIARLEEVTAYVPNFVMSETGIGTTIYIRGIGSGINQGFEQSVGMYRDGIYYGRAQLSRAPLFDMERIEVLRGPQVTLFGNNSIGGAVSMSAARPTDEFEGSFSFLHGSNHGEQEATLVVSSPRFAGFAARFAFRDYQLDGYLKNKTLNRDEPNRDYLTTRLVVDFAPDTDLFNANFIAEKSTFDVKGRQIVIFQDSPSTGYGARATSFAAREGTAGLALGEILSNLSSADGAIALDINDLDSRYSNNDFSFNEIRSYTMTMNLFIGDSELKSISGWLNYNYDDACDCDFSGATLIGYQSDEDYEQFSQEFRLTSGWEGPIELLAGIYFQEDDLLFNDALIAEEDSALQDLVAVVAPGLDSILTNVAGPRSFYQSTTLASSFSQVTINFLDNLRVIAGARRSKTKKAARRTLRYTTADRVSPLSDADFDTVKFGYGIALAVSPHSEEGSRKEWRNSYSMIMEWDITEDILLYTSKKRGFKTGGYDVRSNNPVASTGSFVDRFGNIDPAAFAPQGFTPGSFEFEDEEAVAYELGVKSLIGGFVEINATYFYTEIKDLQVSVFDGGVGFNVSNAAEAVTQGIEVDWRLALTENWSLNGSLGWLDFEFKEYTDGLCLAEDRLKFNGLSGVPFTQQTFPGPDGFLGPQDGGTFANTLDNIIVRTPQDGSNCVSRQVGGDLLYLQQI